MSNLSEEEILKILNDETEYPPTIFDIEKAIKCLLELYQKEKEKNKELEIELARTVELLGTCNKRLENISRYLELNNKNTYGYIYKEVFNKIKELKQENKTLKQCNNNIYATTVDKAIIREKIKELEKQEDWYIENKGLDELYGQIDILKELLEE